MQKITLFFFCFVECFFKKIIYTIQSTYFLLPNERNKSKKCIPYSIVWNKEKKMREIWILQELHKCDSWIHWLLVINTLHTRPVTQPINYLIQFTFNMFFFLPLFFVPLFESQIGTQHEATKFNCVNELKMFNVFHQNSNHKMREKKNLQNVFNRCESVHMYMF